MTDADNNQPSDLLTRETTTMLTRADLFNQTGPLAEGPSEFEEPPAGSALLLVKRGPNVGSRFLLDRPVTSAGPTSRQRHISR